MATTDSSSDPRKQADQLGSLVKDLRSRRQPIEQDWLRFHQAWRGIRNRSFFNSEIFKTFVPAFRRAIEKNVMKLTAMLLPSPEFFEVYPGDEIDPAEGDAAAGWRSVMLYLFAKRIKIKSLVSQLGRTYYLYGRAIAKTGVTVEKVSGTGMVWPTVRAVDPFTFYTWPETVASVDEAQVLSEDHLMPYGIWETLVAEGKVLTNVPPVRELTEPEWPWYWGQRLNVSGVPSPSNTQGDTKARTDEEARPPKFVAISEVWYRDQGQWEMCWLLWSCSDGPRIVRRMTPQTGRHPYRMAVARQLPGEQYTTGMADDLEPLQILLNDQWDMTLEGQAMSFAPISVIDPALIARSAQFKYAPRAKWFTAVDGVKFLEAPDTAKSGYQGIGVTTQLIESFSADNPMSNGMPMRGMPRAGFAVSSMMNLALGDLKDAAQTIEDDILTPMMADIQANVILFMPPDQKMKIPGGRGAQARVLSPVDLAGDYEFRWVGSLQSQDQQVRSQKLLTVLSTLGKVAQYAAPDLAAKGKKIDWEPVITRLWRDGCGERGADSLIIDMTPQEVAAMQKQSQARPAPKVSVSLKGEIDPLVARDLVDDGQINNSMTPQGTGGSAGARPGPDQALPATPEAAGRQQARSMSEPPTNG